MAAGPQAGHAGGLFQHLAAVFRLGIDQFADLSLTDEGGRVGTGAGIGKQELDVLGADFLAIDLVAGPGPPHDTADHFQNGVVIETGGRGPVFIRDHQLDLGMLTRRAGIGTGEDDIFHARAAQGLGRGGSHHPAQSFQQVGFTAAIGTNHARQAGLDRKLGRVHKRLEAGQPE